MESVELTTMLGSTIEGKYRIDGLLGAGGMGKVFKATHLNLNKTFALKLMHFSGASDPTNLARFRREAEALAKIAHPNVVMVTDFGVLQPENIPYIVMEFIEGRTLREILSKDGPLNVRKTISIAKQICAGLAEAHRQGVVHRDLKPENIMIREYDESELIARVLDFGIAKLAQPSAEMEDITAATGLTGTVKYMAPEQFFGLPIDHKADIFTLCLIIYEMLTLAVPPVMLGKFKLPSELVPGITPKMDEVILKGLAQVSQERYESIHDLKKELEAVEQMANLEEVMPEAVRKYITGAHQAAQLEHSTVVGVSNKTQAGVDFGTYADAVGEDEAIDDFQAFLYGTKAPAVIGPSLAKVVKFDISKLVELIYGWANDAQEPFLDALMSARNRVFDIFFYRIVRFDEIHSFFPAFERAMVEACEPTLKEELRHLFAKYRWQDLRPIGNIRGQQQFILEKKKQVVAQADKFNEHVYKNATFSVLSADKRYTFKDESSAERVLDYQSRVKEILDDFIDLVKDKKLKREILLANESDRHDSYENKESFKPESYVTSLADLGIALFNDNYIYQSARVFYTLYETAETFKVNLSELAPLQERAQLLNTYKIEEYASSDYDRVLVRQILGVFNSWHPQFLLEQMHVEENRRVRRALIKVLECFGKSIYPLVLTELSTRARTSPWYYARNLVSLLGRIHCDDGRMRDEAVTLMDSYWHKNAQRQLVLQIIASLGFIGTPLACDKLIERLRQLESSRENDKKSEELCQRVTQALLETGLDKGVQAALDHCQKFAELAQQVERFSKLHLSDQIVSLIISRVQKEVQRMKISFSILGDKETAGELLLLIAHMETPAVREFCQNVIKTLSSKNPLVEQARRVLASEPVHFYSTHPVMQRLALTKNTARMLVEAVDASMSGRMTVRTRDGLRGDIDFMGGEVSAATVSGRDYDLSQSFYWAALLEPVEVESVYFQARSGSPSPSAQSMSEYLLSEAVIQRGELSQLADKKITSDKKFRRHASELPNLEERFKDAARCRAVWEALAKNSDISQLQRATGLGKYDVCKSLHHLLKLGLISVEGKERIKKEIYAIEESLIMVELNLKRIERSPEVYSYYKLSVDICADLLKEADDELVVRAVNSLRLKCLNSYQQRAPLTSEEIDACQHLVKLTMQHARAGNDRSKRALEEHLQSFTSVTVSEEEMEEDLTVLEKIEAIYLANDPLDPLTGVDEHASLKEAGQAVDSVVAAVASEEDAGARLKELFDNVAIACVKPLKDFIRELYRNFKAETATSIDWIDLIEPVLMLLSTSSSKMGYPQLTEVMTQFQNALEQQRMLSRRDGARVFSDEIARRVSACYLKLCELQPKTFAMTISDSELARRKEGLIAKFVLKQLDALDDKAINRVLFAGLNTYEKLLETKPDEIARRGGITRELSEEICLKAYQYRNVYYREGSSDYDTRFRAMFELDLRMLKEFHEDLEEALACELEGRPVEKRELDSLRRDRQRALWSLFILLCIKGQYDLIAQLQHSSFEQRIRALESYAARV